VKDKEAVVCTGCRISREDLRPLAPFQGQSRGRSF
jgi:hypothetical protein